MFVSVNGARRDLFGGHGRSASDHLHRRDRRAGRARGAFGAFGAATTKAGAEPAARRDRGVRPERRRGCSPRPAVRRSSTRPCCGPGASWVLVDRPDRVERVQILEVHLKVRPTTTSIPRRSPLTPGFTGADLMTWSTRRRCSRRGAGAGGAARGLHRAIGASGGPRKRNAARPKSAHRRAPRDGARAGRQRAAGRRRGAGVDLPAASARSATRSAHRGPLPDAARRLMNKMAVPLGGRAAESLVIGELSTGAADDLARSPTSARWSRSTAWNRRSGAWSTRRRARRGWRRRSGRPEGPRYSEETARASTPRYAGWSSRRSSAARRSCRRSARLEAGAARLSSARRQRGRPARADARVPETEQSR